MVHSRSEEHLLGAEVQTSLRRNESGEETKQDAVPISNIKELVGLRQVNFFSGFCSFPLQILHYLESNTTLFQIYVVKEL